MGIEFDMPCWCARRGVVRSSSTFHLDVYFDIRIIYLPVIDNMNTLYSTHII
jgi:hypothetical protein